MLLDEEIALVKGSVSMIDLATRLGFKPNRAHAICCPFHASDDTASLKLYSGQRGFYCFGCHRGGNIFQFTMDYLGMDFETAVRHIASLFSIPLSDREKPIDKKKYADALNRAEIRRREKQKEISARNAKIKRLNEVAGEIHKTDDLLCQFEPLQDMWCHLQNKRTSLENEWTGLFEDLYGNHPLTEQKKRRYG